ncbi:uncharacterized protein PFL1_06498 [Pseudozyma flocculosa PF-1]|uniref:Uncharacterized protein n=2 Tax=Pseudozyma flocculosa TaxID=84751 RepID=A0A5C3EVU3_9BASI|nr:uncharacterized protein PFL1_06498 [Pseudozyma flocculosa PF-1]EPQ26045.1 hypothetical protein PFL1_06498 [Pseudozyma flocculosa PF-1]SPO35646.1 uncharacterized protein PSFLO_01117 [Pseudozyma flocculosa]
MASVTLDYGAASDAASSSAQQADPMAIEDENMADGNRDRQAKLYAVPREEGIDAGARRGPSPLSREEHMALDDAKLVGVEEPSEVPSPPPVEGGSDVRLDTLLIEGLPITQMSTSRLFAYVAHFGAQPLGLEWVDDERCNIVFPTEEAARIALEYLCPATDMSTEPLIPLPNLQTILETSDEEWDPEVISSLVAPRKAHRMPGKLYTSIERQAARAQLADQSSSTNGASTLPDDVPEIYREMEEADRRQHREKPEYVALAKLRSALYVRHAVKDWDVKPSRAASRSQWYKEHGQEAGKEIVPRLLDVGEVSDAVELFPSTSSKNRAFGSAGLPARPHGAATEADSEPRRGRGPSDRRAVMDELDSELDAHLASRQAGGALHEQKLEGQMMADLVEDGAGTASAGGDLFDRLKDGRGRGRPSGSSATRWGHDDFERQALDKPRRRGGRGERGSDGRGARDALDADLDGMFDARERRRSASPVPRGSGGGDGGRVKIKGRGRMKAPGGGSMAWGGQGEGDDEQWADYGTERYGEARKDRRRRGAEASHASGDLAARLGAAQSERGDLMSRLGDAAGQRSLADRFS